VDVTKTVEGVVVHELWHLLKLVLDMREKDGYGYKYVFPELREAHVAVKRVVVPWKVDDEGRYVEHVNSAEEMADGAAWFYLVHSVGGDVHQSAALSVPVIISTPSPQPSPAIQEKHTYIHNHPSHAYPKPTSTNATTHAPQPLQPS